MKRELIPQWFTNDFIIESPKFVLKNINFYLMITCTFKYLAQQWAKKFAPPYVCLTVCYLEETKLFVNKSPKFFSETECKLIMKLLKRYMNYGFVFSLLKLNFQYFKSCLDNMLPSFKFRIEKPETVYENQKKVQALNILDVKKILHEDNSYETDICYKPKNTLDYLPYASADSGHTKKYYYP